MKIRYLLALVGLAISFALPALAGSEMWWNGEWHVTLQGQTGGPKQAKGYWTSIVVREGDTWKDRMQISIVAQSPAVTPSPTTTPSN